MAEDLRGVILVVDDNSASLYAKSRVLRHAGFTVIEAGTGSEALALVPEAQPDLVLLDVNLPDINGHEVCRRLKMQPATAHLLVLQISASFVEVQDKTRALEGGADGYLAEPVHPEELIATVRAFLRLRKTEAALRASEERLRVALAAGKMATWDWDIPHGHVIWSEGLEPMLGLTRGAFGGTFAAFRDLVHPADRARVEAAVEQAIRERTEYQLEFRMMHVDGHVSWVEARGRAYYNAQGEPVRMAGIHHDITERKAATEALHTLNESLEERVRARTAELERSNRDLDQFAYVASHDLKAPLRGINHLAKWIMEDAGDLLPAASQRHLHTLQGRVHRMEQLLEDLLIYSRAGRQQGQLETVVSGELVTNLLELIDPPATFTVTVAASMPTFRTWRVPLEVVLRNLISNAVKHHHRTDGHITVAAEAQGNWVEFTVQDDGPGIDAAFHERIFQVFQTLQPRDEVEGSGMGLAVVKKVVESVGGAIHVESAEGEGATFRFSWPLFVL
ncbi:MAG: ATP-binding protein [Caldilineaceae bacterium]